MTFESLIAVMQSEQDQDEMNALQWWAEHSNEVKSDIWDRIQEMGRPDDKMGEIISRFAQLGFTHVALLAQPKKV